MTPHKLTAIALLFLGLAASPSTWAHERAHASIGIGIGHGPIQLGIGLSHLLHRHHRRAVHSHIHGPICYRNYPGHHNHWGTAPRADTHSSHHRPQRHEQHAEYPRWQRYANHPPRRAGHVRRSSGHRHSRDCNLHFGRDHPHWR